jgi:hypothetical protein
VIPDVVVFQWGNTIVGGISGIVLGVVIFPYFYCRRKGGGKTTPAA